MTLAYFHSGWSLPILLAPSSSALGARATISLNTKQNQISTLRSLLIFCSCNILTILLTWLNGKSKTKRNGFEDDVWKVQQWSNIRFRLLYVVELDSDDCWITMAAMHCPAGSTPRVGGDQGWSLFVHAITHHNHSYHYKHYIASNFHGRESNQTVIGFYKHYFLQHFIYVCKSSINIEQKVFA